jgi:oligopeptide transport system substrate-binding protein
VRKLIPLVILLALVVSACTQATVTPMPVTVQVTVPVTVKQTVQVPVLITATPSFAPQVLRWSLEGSGDPATLDPARITDAPGALVARLLFGGLTRLDAELTPTPDAATWTISEDDLQYTFKLRSGLKFSDGTPVTADDVVFSLTRALDPASSAGNGLVYLGNILGADELAAGRAKTLEGVKALDPQTVLITLKQPAASLLTQLAYPAGLIVSQKQAQANVNWANQPTGAGPFLLKEWARGQRLVLAPNPHYAGGPIQIAELQMPFLPDADAATLAYRAGDLDVMGSPKNLADVRDLPDLRTVSAFAVRYVGFNSAAKPFNDARARQAFARAIDRQALADKVLGRTAHVTERILPAGMMGSELPVQGLAFNPEAARKLLSDAGYPFGRGLAALTVAYSKEGDNERVVTWLQTQWRDTLGVNVTLLGFEPAAFVERLTSLATTPDKSPQLFYGLWSADYADPQNLLSQQLGTSRVKNYGRYSSVEFDRFIEQADISSSGAASRRRLYNQAEQIAVNDAGWLPLFNPTVSVLIKPYVQGLVVTGQGILVPDWSAVRGKLR